MGFTKSQIMRSGTLKQRRKAREARAKAGTSNRTHWWGLGDNGENMSYGQKRSNLNLIGRSITWNSPQKVNDDDQEDSSA
jgi:hypothetical protein